MDAMPAALSWMDMGGRFAATIVAGLLIGYNRDEHGKAAGMRTTLIVCLAASAAMMQMNLLLPLAGRRPDSFVMNDLMRLPLGILTGVGFIGGGVILRRGDMVLGVTTAATLWLVTVIGLCIGGGQFVLAAGTTIIGMAALWGLGAIKPWLAHEHPAHLSVALSADGPSEQRLRQWLSESGLRIVASSVSLSSTDGSSRTFDFDLHEVTKPREARTPSFVATLAHQPGVTKVEWRTRS